MKLWHISAAGMVTAPPLLKVISYVMTANSIMYPQQATVYDGENFDFVVIGAGSAGCVLVNRLTEVSNWSVLLVEAGGDPPLISNLPGLYAMVESSSADWNYYTQNDGYSSQAHKTKTLHYTRGKMLGGSSGANYMFYVRGNKIDYEYWVEQGNEGWDWNNVTAYFKKSERLVDKKILNGPTKSLHGTDGYLGVTTLTWTDITKDYLKAFQENGHNLLIDSNGEQQLGYSTPSFTIDNNIRQSTANAFLSPIRNRPNLFVLKNALGRKIFFDGSNKAIGAEISLSSGEIINVLAHKEVIVSAGAINSPQLLMLSGIGPKDHLVNNGIEILLDSPQVGENLQDHVTSLVVVTGKNNYSSFIRNFNTLEEINTFPTPMFMGQIALNNTQTYPDYQTLISVNPASSVSSSYLCSVSFGLQDELCKHLALATVEKEALVTEIVLLKPKSRGNIRLRNKDPVEKVLINTGYYSNKNDLEVHARSIADFVSIVNTTTMMNINSEVVYMVPEKCNEFVIGSIDYWKCYALNTASSIWHAVGTCAMAPEGIGVVDERLRVRGVTSLRVVDASVMPTIVSGNTNAPVIMIAEKAADMIKLDHGINIDI